MLLLTALLLGRRRFVVLLQDRDHVYLFGWPLGRSFGLHMDVRLAALFRATLPTFRVWQRLVRMLLSFLNLRNRFRLLAHLSGLRRRHVPVLRDALSRQDHRLIRRSRPALRAFRTRRCWRFLRRLASRLLARCIAAIEF